jgi:hypothetical protein
MIVCGHIFLFEGREVTRLSWFKLFYNPADQWNCLALHCVWAAMVVSYYGGLLNIKNVGEHLYLNVAMAGEKHVQTFLRLRHHQDCELGITGFLDFVIRHHHPFKTQIFYNFSFNLTFNWMHNDSSSLSPIAFQVVHNPQCLVTSVIL